MREASSLSLLESAFFAHCSHILSPFLSLSLASCINKILCASFIHPFVSVILLPLSLYLDLLFCLRKQFFSPFWLCSEINLLPELEIARFGL